MQEKIFRKSALDRLSSPERLDTLMQVVSFKAWLVPLAALGLIGAALLWGFTGRIPITVNGQGVLLHGGRIDTLESPVSGLLVELLVEPGDTIERGAVIARVSQPPGDETFSVASPFSGRVLEIQIREGAYVQPGMTVLTLEPVGEPLEAVIYVSPTDGKKLKAGMSVQLRPSTIRQEEDGYLLGTVTFISQLPMRSESMVQVLGNEDLVRQLSVVTNPIEVRVSLQANEANPSGYEWTSPQGPDIVIQGGTFTTGRIILREIRPIDLMLATQ